MAIDHDELFARLGEKGEEAVRIEFAKGTIYAGEKAKLVCEWLAAKDRERSDLAASKQESREEEALEISRLSVATADKALEIANEANRIAKDELATAQASATSAKEQARWAKWAALIAMLAALISVRDEILALVFR